MEDFFSNLITSASDIGLRIVFGLVILIVGFKVIKWMLKLLPAMKLYGKLPEDVRRFTLSALSFILKLIVVLTVISVLGVPMTSIVALLGTAGLAVGLALEGSLANFAGGFILMLFHPFRVGDFIDTGTYDGFVEEIGVFYTYLKTYDNSRIMLPNSVVSNSTVRNYTANDTRRLDITFATDYSSDIEKVKRVLLETATVHPLVLKEPAPLARLLKQNDSSLDFTLRVWCNTHDYWTVMFDLNENVKHAFDENGISIPFPQMDVHIKDGKNK